VELVRGGALQRLIAAMQAHPAAVEVQRLAIATLYNTLRDEPDQVGS
jgi:hypothetical protein